MRCPSLYELPPPPVDKTGWPWREESPRLPDTIGSDRPWPRISVVSASYNQGRFIEETIRSVLLQGYPNLEYIIIDGCSADGSVEIIHKYEPWLAYWVSERDRGPAHAVNKGFERVTGDLIALANCDDYFLPRAFGEVAAQWVQHGVGVYYGRCQAISEEGNLMYEDIWRPPQSCTWTDFLRGTVFPITSAFLPGKLIRVGTQIDESLELANDWEFCLRVLESLPAHYINKHLSSFRLHPGQRTARLSIRQIEEHLKVLKSLLRQERFSASERCRIVSALGRFMILKSSMLMQNGNTVKSIATGLFGYMLDFQMLNSRVSKLLKNPYIIATKARNAVRSRPR